MTSNVVKLVSPANPLGLTAQEMTPAMHAYKPIEGACPTTKLPNYLLTSAVLPEGRNKLTRQFGAMVQLTNFATSQAAREMVFTKGDTVGPRSHGYTHAGKGDATFEARGNATFKVGSVRGHGHQ